MSSAGLWNIAVVVVVVGGGWIAYKRREGWGSGLSTWAALSAVIFGFVVLRELSYRSSHPHTLGPSGELIALGSAGVLVSIVVAVVTAKAGASADDAQATLVAHGAAAHRVEGAVRPTGKAGAGQRDTAAHSTRPNGVAGVA